MVRASIVIVDALPITTDAELDIQTLGTHASTSNAIT
jgi:hypothetical protein